MYYKEIPIDRIKLFPQSELPPLPSMSSDELAALKESIREFGILQPLVVTVNGDDVYLLQAGHNRLQIARDLGLSNIPCCVILKNDDITNTLMGSHTDGFRRHLTPSQKNELLIWQAGIKKNNRCASQKPNSSTTSSSEDESALLKKIINQKGEIIDNLQNELENKKKTFTEKEADLKIEIIDKKEQIKVLKEEYMRAIEDAEEIRYQSYQTKPSDDERITKLQKDLDDANKRANRISEELTTARSKKETLEECLRKEKNNNLSITAGIHVKLYRLRRETIAQGKLRVATELLSDTEKIISEIADIVKRDEVNVDTKSFLTLLEKLTAAVSAIPFYHSKQESVDTVTGQ